MINQHRANIKTIHLKKRSFRSSRSCSPWGSWYAQACTSYYEAAEAVDLGRLFYDGIGYAGLVYGQCYVTDRERDWVLEQEPAAENYGIFRAPGRPWMTFSGSILTSPWTIPENGAG